MQLRIFLETTGQSWTLKPGREYLMGTSPDCDITLAPIDDSIAYIKFKFDDIGSFWHIENLQKADFTTLLNTQRLTRSIIQSQSQLKIVGQSIVLMPETIVAPTQVSRQVPQYQRAATQDGSSLVEKEANKSEIKLVDKKNSLPEARPDRPIDRKLIREYFECLKKRRLAQKIQEPLLNQIWRNFSQWIRNKRLGELGVPFYVILGMVVLLLILYPTATIILVILVIFVLAMQTTSRDPVLPTPPVQDKQIDFWLMQDFENFGERARKVLKILTSEEGGMESQNTMVSKRPIMLLSPIQSGSERAKISYSLSWIDEKDKVSLGAENSFHEQGLDEIYRGSLNDFMIIFLCRNFISYYRGTWNSIDDILLDELTAEFMYDCVASIKTQEYSNSWKLKDKDGNKAALKIVDGEVLSFSTNDGETTNFEMSSDVKNYFDTDYISTAKEAAEHMRREIRQRRIDVQVVKNQLIE